MRHSLRQLRRPWLWVLLFWAQLGRGAPVEGADLLELYGLAQRRDPAVQAARAAQLSIRESLPQAYAGLLPSVTLGAGYDLTRQEIINSKNPMYEEGVSEFDGYNLTLTLTQPLFRYASMVQIRQARAAVQRAEFEFAVAEQELVRRVAELYVVALAAQDEVRFSRAERDALELHHQLARVQQEKGLVPITDLYDAEARLSLAEAREIAAKNALDDALEGLREVSGEWVTDLARLEQEFPLIPPDPEDEQEWVSAALAQNLTLQARNQAVAVAAREVERRRAGQLPTVDLVARGNRQDTGGTLYGKGYDSETMSLRVELNIPVYQGGYRRSQVKEARMLYEQSASEQEKQVRAVERQTRSAYWGVVSEIGRVAALQKSVAAAELAVEARQKGFRSGLLPSLDVLDGIRDLYMVRRDYAQARYQYILNSLRLKETVGALNRSDIAAVNEWLEE